MTAAINRYQIHHHHLGGWVVFDTATQTIVHKTPRSRGYCLTLIRKLLRKC